MITVTNHTDTNNLTLVLTTINEMSAANHISTTLVEEGLAACVNILPGIRSVYRWKGNLEQEQEILLIIKTAARYTGRLFARIRQLHGYETPELIAIPVSAVEEKYLRWALDSITG